MVNKCCNPSEDSMLCVQRMNHHCYNHLQHLTSTLVVPSSCPKYTHPSPNTQIFIKTLSGKTMTLLVDLKKDSVLSVKEMIYQKTYIPALKQRLIHRQLQLEDNKKLSDYPTIGKDSTFHLVLRLVAGVNTKSSGKSRSKKTTSPVESEEAIDITSNQIITSDNSSTSLTPTSTADSSIPKPDDGTPVVDASIINTSSINELITTSSSNNNNPTTRKSRSKSNASSKKSSKKSTTSSSTEIKVKEEPMDKDNTIVMMASDLTFQSSPSENSTSPSSSTNPSSNSNALEAYSDESETDDDSDDSDSADEDGKPKGKKSGKNKKRGSYTKRACINCRTAHAACDSGRPCKRCIQLGKADSCRDAERKRTKKRTLNEYENAPVFFPSLDSFIPLLSGLQPAPPLETVQKTDDTSNMSTGSEHSEKKATPKDEFTPKTTTRIKKERETKRKSKSQSSNSNEKKIDRMDMMEISQQPEKPLNSELAEIFAPETSHSTFLDMESSPTTEQDVQIFFDDEDISKKDHLSEAFHSGIILSPESNNGQHIEEVPTSTALALVPNNPDNQQLISILQSYNGTLPFDLTEAISQSNNNDIVKMLLYEYLRQSQELRELKQLVASLQITLINLNPPQFSPSPNSSTTLNDISNNTM